MKERVHFTDGEGPIVFKDLAADITGKITLNSSRSPQREEIPGHKFFAVLSLYDDYLAEVGTEGYQAGDTLALVVPHFLAHGVRDEDVVSESRDAKVCFGVEDYIKGLQRDRWNVRIISTAYSPMWELIGGRLGIPMEQIACTNLDLRNLRNRFTSNGFLQAVEDAEGEIISHLPLAEKAVAKVDAGEPVEKVFGEDPEIAPLTKALDGFYWQTLPEMGYNVLEEVRVMGGRRKVGAAQEFARELGVGLSDVSYTGDSITDDKIHEHLRGEQGLPIGLNGNKYALRNARVAVATTDMRKIRPVLDAWVQGGMDGVNTFIKRSNELSFSPRKEGAPSYEIDSSVRYHVVDLNNQEAFKEMLGVHKEFRTAVRGLATARLG